MPHLSLHPTLRTCSSDTILRAIKELTQKNITYKSECGRSYDFNLADRLNRLLVKALIATGQLKAGESYDMDFDYQFIETICGESPDLLMIRMTSTTDLLGICTR